MNLKGLPTKSTAEWVDVALILPDRDRVLFWLLIGAICARSTHWIHVHELWAAASIDSPVGFDRARQLLHQWKEDHVSFNKRLDIGA